MHTLTRPTWEKADIKIFDWSDDFSAFESNEDNKRKITESVDYYLKTADIVLTINEKLSQQAKTIAKHVLQVPNATNYFTFKQPGTLATIAELEALSGPIIGYIGWLNPTRLDSELIDYMAKSRPDYNFVFMGPSTDEHPLGMAAESNNNVYILPPRQYTQLYSVYNYFDVCILPNLINEHTNGNDPIKLYDYLASGKPLVTTNTSGADKLADVISIAHSHGEFLEAIDDSLAGDNGETEARVKLAFDNSWEKRITLILDEINTIKDK
ncbi:hypothetical protein BST96_10560 [Oceanicoccus sagamiensis]|uniref:Glycosyltransferase n=2 Tax=Oceanicoccus sagamiensis TaxID=716816 RepID=A0A1X9NDP3_9GAMM|nr:hypothetical protein BST96_10560 [Oceanicoccus sagamiensis]